MSQSPPPVLPFAQPAYLPPGGPNRTNGMAVASLICGIVGCVPFVTGLLAIVFGWIGLRRSRDPQVGGRGLAIAGLVLGILSVVGWGTVVGTLGAAYAASSPGRAAARQFLQDLSAGNVGAAAANSTTGMTQQTLTSTAQQLQAFGVLQGVAFTSFNLQSRVGTGTTLHLAGIATFANGTHPCTVDLVKQGGTYKVAAFDVK